VLGVGGGGGWGVVGGVGFGWFVCWCGGCGGGGGAWANHGTCSLKGGEIVPKKVQKEDANKELRGSLTMQVFEEGKCFLREKARKIPKYYKKAQKRS